MHKNILTVVGITILFLGVVVTPMTLGYDVKSDMVSDSPPMDSPWPMQSHDTKHTGRSPYSTADNPYDEKWRFGCDWVEGGSVIDDNGNIYFGDFDDYLYSLYPDGTLNWKYKTGDWIWSTPAIGDDGTIFIGTQDTKLYAINPNGTLKWKIGTGGSISSSPAIADDGTIYIGNFGNKIVAVNPNGTIKWKYDTGDVITSDPAISDNGIVYIGSQDSYLYALWPNGTLYWRFKTGTSIMGPPSIAEDGTIYVGSWDDYLYALNPDGSMKWSHPIGEGSAINPSIGGDDTIYIGYENLYAIYPNGTRRWTFSLGAERHIQGSSPAVCSDGIIYVGTNIGEGAGGELIAINPDGTERWRKKIVKDWVDASPSIGQDGTVYIGGTKGVGEGGYFFAFGVSELEADAKGPYYGQINESIPFQGSAKGGYRPHSYHWDFGDGNNSDEQNPPHTYASAGKYIVTFTVTDNESNTAVDTTYAWIQDGNTPPDTPDIDGPTSGRVGIPYDYKFSGTDSDGSVIHLFVDWDDGSNSGWLGPDDSGQEITLSHKWSKRGTYTIKVKAKDPYDEEGPEGTLVVTIPRNRIVSNPLLLNLLERYPLLEVIISRIPRL